MSWETNPYNYKGKTYYVPNATNAGGWLGGLSKDEEKEVIEFILENGRAPSDLEMENFDNKIKNNWFFQRDLIDGIAKSILGDERNKDLIVTPESAGESDEDIETPFYNDPNKITQPGTKENELLQLYKKSNETQRDIFERENQQTQVDMMRELDAQRRQTLEEVRNRRRTMLKNGLSSAQIANEEVQSLMMSQNTNRMIADQYIRERGNIRNSFARNDANAVFNVGDIMNNYNANGAAFAAAKAGDANYMAQLYRKNLNRGNYTEDDYATTTGQKPQE